MEAIWRDYWQIIRRWPLPHRLVAIGDRVAHDRHDFGTKRLTKALITWRTARTLEEALANLKAAKPMALYRSLK